MSLRLGKYELLSRIAKGGMAETFRAQLEGAAGVTKQVVIKKVLPSLAQDEAFIAAFINEAKLSASLSHGNIAQVFEFGRAGDDYFIAMEWVDGRSLAQVFARAAELKIAFLPPSIACFLAIEVLKALHYAHTRLDDDGKPLNIVHRDVSPENILVSFEGQAKVIDFGIAKAARQTVRDTEPGMVKGKYLYFSPEQADAQPVDARSDVFTLGAVLYEMLCGAMAFRGPLEPAIASIQQCRYVPLREVNPLVPERLAEVVSRAMAKDVSQRYDSALEMQQALTSLLYREDPTFSSETVKDWMSSLFNGQTAVKVEEPLEPPRAVIPEAALAPIAPEEKAELPTWILLASVLGILGLGLLMLAALRSEPEEVARPIERAPAQKLPPVLPRPVVAAPVDAFVYPATVVVRAPRHRIRFEGFALPPVEFAAGTKPRLVEREATDEDDPLFFRSSDGQVSLVLQRPGPLAPATGGALFDFQPFGAAVRGTARQVDVGDPPARLEFKDELAVVDARSATWLTVENVPPDEKVRLTLRATDPAAWAGRPRPVSVLVVWKRSFGRLLPPPGGDWPDELDRAVLTSQQPLVVEHATALAFVFADPLATAEKDSALVEIFGTGEPASKPDPAAVARAAKAHLEKAAEAPTGRRRAIPKTIDFDGPGADVFFDEGLTLFQQGKLAQARGKLEKCVSMAPKDFECHKLLGAVLDRLGDGTRAVRAYREYLRLAPPADPDVAKVRLLIGLHERKR